MMIPPAKDKQFNRLRLAIVLLVVSWTFAYNLLILDYNVVAAFFGILDTISDDFVVGTLLTLAMGGCIVLAFSVTKLYTQVISNIYSMAILEHLVFTELAEQRVWTFMYKVINLQDQPKPSSPVPVRVGSLLFAFAFLYAMSWIYVGVFSEALFFLSWSAGVNLEITPDNLLLLPTLALAIPFSARVMAYLRYPYTQDYADFIPGAVFVLIIVVALGYLFESNDQKFFLLQVYDNPDYLAAFLKNGVFLAFIPVFFEAAFWLFELTVEED